ncbi:dynamin family protein [Rossellomorea marisflavi]|uniref:dynamin family protein n=1 Tax=Rossellomorea marisflavi TaxID=189381 RepID=UPI00345AC422
MNRPEPKHLVVGTMSSGKSTFINSLIGYDLLPSRNEACSAKIITYSASARRKAFMLEKNNDGKFHYRKKVDLALLSKWNVDREIRHISIKGPLSTIKKKSTKFSITDTPGPNNSMDKNHRGVMENALDTIPFESIFYLLNASQLGTEDDQQLLSILKHKRIEKSIIFVVNKADVIDSVEEENLTLFSTKVEKYLVQNGFESPRIYFVSSLAALLASKRMQGANLTIKESILFKKLSFALEEDLSINNVNTESGSDSFTELSMLKDPLWEYSGISKILKLF